MKARAIAAGATRAKGPKVDIIAAKAHRATNLPTEWIGDLAACVLFSTAVDMT